MGERGLGAGSRKAAIRALQAQGGPRDLPWKRPGLTRPQRVLAFLEFLPVTKGIMVGQAMELLPDQREFVEQVYGRLKPDGRREVKIAVKSAAKGNGKTGMVAGLALCHLLGPECEARGEVYSAALDRLQAGITFKEMEAIINAVPEFGARVNIQRFGKLIEVLEGDGEGSIYEALSSDARRGHGLAPSLWIYDELAQVKDRELLDNLKQGMGKRREALGIVISTQAQSDDHALSQMIDDGLGGEHPDLYVQLIAVDPDDDVFDEEVLRRANPAWGRFLDIDDLLQMRSEAQRNPASEPAFRNLRANQRIDTATELRLTTAAIWKLGDVAVDLDRLARRPCYGGLDLSGKKDLTAFELVFPDDEDEPGFDIVSFFWTPEGQLQARPQAEKELFELWIKSKHLTAVPGAVIRYAFIAREIAKLKERFDIRAIGYDPWRIDDLKADMAEQDIDLPLANFGQGFKSMAPAVDYFTELALEGKLRHDGNPVLKANVASAILISDTAGNQKIDKPKSRRRATTRIDGAVALLIALGTARSFVEEKKSGPSFWEVAARAKAAAQRPRA